MQFDRCRRDLELDALLPSMLDGSAAPDGAVESLELTETCLAKGRHGAAAAFYLKAFEAAPSFAADKKSGYRYRAACAAAMAEADTSDDKGPGWRRESREWLRGELGQYAERLGSANRLDAVRTYFTLTHWLTDPALTSVRDEAQLTGILHEEADQCRQLWRYVRAVRERAEKKAEQVS